MDQIALAVCRDDVFRKHPFNSCSLFLSTAGAAVLASALLGSLSFYRLQRARSYQLLPTSGNGLSIPVDGLLLMIRLLVGLTILSLMVDLGLLMSLGLAKKLWVGELLIWNISQLLVWLTNRQLLVNETTQLGTYSLAVSSLWAVMASLESVVLFEWVATMTVKRVNPLQTYSQYLFANFLLRFILTWLTAAVGLVLARYFTRVVPPSDIENGTGELFDPNRTALPIKSIARKLKTLMPFLWPSGHYGLQLLMLASFGVLAFGRVVNPLIPFLYKKVVNALTESKDRSSGVPVWPIVSLVVVRFLQSGLLSNVQSFLWLPIGQFTTRTISVRMFRHLHGLSLRFHVNRKTGEILRVLDRGTSSIVSLLQMILFTLVPVVIDISVAVLVIALAFDIYFGLIVLITMASYLAVTIIITEWRTKYRREMIELDNKTNQYSIDSLLNFETVKYYNAEDFEVTRYNDAIRKFNVADFKSSTSLQCLNVLQNTVISIGLLIACLLCGWRIVYDDWTSGDFVLVFTYIIQLYGPLNWFGTMYRVIQQNFIDMEKMLQLFEEQADIQDSPLATELDMKGGQIDFVNVKFAYDERQPALNRVSFQIPAGATVALVATGPSGGGKSTILRLLFRFYDITSGTILVDGQDIREVTQKSLRRHIGVVPQDTVLFNDTIRYNIRYAKPDATDEEVEQAAAAAQIHERILSFPDQYNTVVGERGLRLSGGEKQRVAIARTILKNPSIILLDEATSALDTSTERHIQASLNELCKGRTTLVIAHRLSTIVSADVILVLKGGEIVEMGNHRDLVNQNGIYNELWNKQSDEHSLPATKQD